MLYLWLHIFSFFGLINFLLPDIIIINSLFIIIPIVLILFLCLLPCQRGILIIKINIFHINRFVCRFAELGTRKYFSWLLLDFLGLFYDSISSKYYGSWSIRFTRFLWSMGMLWFIIISWSIFWRVALPQLRIEIFWWRISVILLIFSWFWELSFHLCSLLNYKKKVL